MFPINTILHPTDFSVRSHKAFELACALASQHGARVILLHVAKPPEVPPLPYEKTTETDEVELRHQLEELRSERPELIMDYALEQGEADEGILRIADEADCDVIVMGTHGRSGIGRLLMGSVAEQVVRRAHCPVITIRDVETKRTSAYGKSGSTAAQD